MKKIAVVLMFCLLASAAFGQNWFQGSFDDALGKAKSEGKMVLIDFFSGG